MKINPHVAVGNVVGFGLLASAYLLEKSSCLGLPDWAIPVLTTIQIGLNMLGPSLWKKEA